MAQTDYESIERLKLDKQFNIIGSSEYWELIVPLTFEAMKWFGRDTGWHTVSDITCFNRPSTFVVFYPKNGDLRTRVQVSWGKKVYLTVTGNQCKNTRMALTFYNDNIDMVNDAIELSNKVLETHERLCITVERAKEMLANGIPCNEVFDKCSALPNGYTVVRLNNRSSMLDNNGELIDGGQRWYNYISQFVDGYAIVLLKKKSSFINEEGKLIGDGREWFDEAKPFVEGYASIRLGGLGWSFIDKNGDLIGDGNQWYDKVGEFYQGYANVKLKGKWSFINAEGKLIGDGNQWYQRVWYVVNGYARVQGDDGVDYKLREDGVLCDEDTLEPVEQNNTDMDNEQTVRITEGQLRRLIRESVIGVMTEKKKKVVRNDEGEIVPDVCPKCGSKVGLYIKGEPVYLCSNEKCEMYFGTAPCDLNEGWRGLAAGAAMGAASLLGGMQGAQAQNQVYDYHTPDHKVYSLSTTKQDSILARKYYDYCDYVTNHPMSIEELAKIFPQAYKDRNKGPEVWRKHANKYAAQVHGKCVITGMVAARNGENPWNALVKVYTDENYKDKIAQENDVFNVHNFPMP